MRNRYQSTWKAEKNVKADKIERKMGDIGIGVTSFRTRLFDTWHPKDERPSSIALKLYGQLSFPNL